MQISYLFIRILIAHLIGDFILQPQKWVKHKAKYKVKSKYLYIHALIHGILTYIIVGDWQQFWLPLLVILIHFAIDLLKSYQKKNFVWFLLDQGLHLISLSILWVVFNHKMTSIFDFISTLVANDSFWKILFAYLFITTPTAIIINNATKKWQKEIRTKKKNDSLKDAGKWIGILERILTLTFILIGEFSAIGFLIAAKSIFRFGDLTNGKERKLTEYILIGTLLSFTITILIGILTKNILV